MNKQTVAQILDEMASLLELKGENPFKVHAYERAARAVLEISEDLGEMIEADSLTSIDGIGKNLSEHITEIWTTGRLKEHEKLKNAIPSGVIGMLAIPGLGSKKVRVIWEKMGIKTIAELEAACRNNKLASLPGFGKKTEEKILAGIDSLKRFAGKWLFVEGYALAYQVHKQMKRWPEVLRSEIAGSIRRRKEVIKDIDILVATDKPERVMERFVSLPGIQRIVQHGPKKSEVILQAGIQCDLRVVSDGEYPFALHYFTGSKEHNVRMRGLAKTKDMKMNEYGLFKGNSKKTISCMDERAVFKSLGLEYIEPELREDMGEVEAAAKKELPKLVELSDLKGIMHAHSTYTDGTASVEEMARAAKSKGFKYLLISDHSQAVTVAGGMKPAEAKEQHDEIDALNKRIKGFRVLKGVEVDILQDGSLDYDDKLLSSYDVVIGAIHSRFGMKEDEMTKRIIDGMSNPHVDILAHPTGRLLLSREPYAVDMKRVIDAIGEMKKGIEINAHPQRLDLDWRWLKYAKGRGVKFAICPDAHSPEGLGHAIFGVWIARKGWLEKEDVLNCMTAVEVVSYFK